MEEPSVLDKILWLTVSKKLKKPIEQCIVIKKKGAASLFVKKILLLQFCDLLLFRKLKRKAVNFSLHNFFNEVTFKAFDSGADFNNWLTDYVTDADVQIISTGCPFLLKKDFLKKLNNPPINLHNSDTNKIRGHFGTFWEFSKCIPKCVVLHKINSKVDDGEVIKKWVVKCIGKETLLRVLVLKKIAGGILLSGFINGNLRLEQKLTKGSMPTVYPFPSVKDILYLKGHFLISNLRFLMGKSK